MVYFLVLFQIFFIGISLNLRWVIFERRTLPEHLAIGIEINLCAAQFFSALCPIIAKAEAPIPIIVSVVLSLTAIYTVNSIGPVSSKNDLSVRNLETTLNSIINQTGNMNKTDDQGVKHLKKWI